MVGKERQAYAVIDEWKCKYCGCEDGEIFDVRVHGWPEGAPDDHPSYGLVPMIACAECDLVFIDRARQVKEPEDASK